MSGSSNYIYIIKKEKPLRINIKLTATNDLPRPPKMTGEMVESTWANIGFLLYQLDPKIRKLVRRLISSLEDFKKETIRCI